mgnify:CR=1 FL=1
MQVDGLAAQRAGTMAGMSARAGAGIAIAVLTVFLLAACGPNGGPAPTASVDISSPTPTPIETPEIPQVAEYIPYPEPTPDILVPYEQMSFADFEALPKQEQAPYVSWLTRNLDTLKAEWRNQRIDTPFDEVDVDISRDNSAQEIDISLTWTLRIAASLKAEDARKVITFLIASKNESSRYDALIAIGDVPDRNPRAMAEALMFSIGQVTSETDLATNSNGVEFKDYTSIVGLTGEDSTNTGYYHEYTDYAGQPYPVWLSKS